MEMEAGSMAVGAKPGRSPTIPSPVVCESSGTTLLLLFITDQYTYINLLPRAESQPAGSLKDNTRKLPCPLLPAGGSEKS